MSHSLHSLLRAVNLRIPPGLADPLILMVTVDSRAASLGSLFIGLPGQKLDGGVFWTQALHSGAVAAVISSAAAKRRPPKIIQAISF